MSRARRTAYGVAADLLFQIAFVVTGFLTTPWIVRWLGQEAFGAYRTLLDWLSVIGALEWGLGGALMAALAATAARGDTANARSLLRAGAHGYLRLTAWMLAAGVALTIVAPRLFASTSLPPGEIRAATAISALGFLFTPLFLFRAIAEGQQLHYRVTLAMLVQTLVLNGLWLVAAALGWGLPGQAVGLVVAQGCGFTILALGRWREVSAAIREPLRAEDVRALRDRSPAVLAIGLVDRLLVASGTLTIGWIAGPAAVVPYFLTVRLASVAQTQLKAVGDSSWAALVELHVSGGVAAMRERLLELTSAVSGVGVSVLAAFVAFNGRFVDLWVGEALYAGDLVTLLAALDAWLLSLYGLWVAPIFGLGELRRWLPYASAFAAASLVVGAGATWRLGAPGPLVGVAAGFALVVSWALPARLGELVSIEPHRLWEAALRPLFWGVPLTFVAAGVARVRAPAGWIELALGVGACVAVGIASCWLVTLDRDRRDRWRGRLRDLAG